MNIFVCFFSQIILDKIVKLRFVFFYRAMHLKKIRKMYEHIKNILIFNTVDHKQKKIIINKYNRLFDFSKPS